MLDNHITSTFILVFWEEEKVKRKINFEDYQPLTLGKYPYVRSKKLTQSANGEICTMGMPGCTYDSKTTVWAHANYDFCGKGGSIKASDPMGCYACQACHDLYDGRRHDPLVTEESKFEYFWKAHVKSFNRLIEKGLITVAT